MFFYFVIKFGGFKHNLIIKEGLVMEKYSQGISIFRSITEDFAISDQQIKKYLDWGSFNMEQALNYYFRKKEKYGNENPNGNGNPNGKSSIGQHEVKHKQKYSEKQSKQRIINSSSKQTKADQIVQSYQTANCQESKQEATTVFDKMRKASVKQKKVQDFISRVRKQYQLPVNGKIPKGSQMNGNEKNQIQEQPFDVYEVQEQFKCADYLPSVFNNQMQDEQASGDEDEDLEFMEDQIQRTEDVKKKLSEVEIEKIEKNNKIKEGYSNQIEQKPYNFGVRTRSSRSKESKTQFQSKFQAPNVRKNNKSIQLQNTNSFKQVIKKVQPKQEVKYQAIQKMEVDEVQIFNINKPRKSIQISKVQMPNEVYVGEYFFQGFKTDTNPFPQSLKENLSVQFSYYIQPQKKKKGGKSVKALDRAVNMRIVFCGVQICRVQDHQARIFVPLITQNIIRLQVILFQLPQIINTFSKLKFMAKVYLKKKALTEPVVQTFDGQSEQIVSIYKSIRQELAGLLERLDLKVKKQPLLKSKSKFSKKINKGKQFSLARMSDQQFRKRAEQNRLKQQSLSIRKKNDPFFKQKQVNLSEMMRGQQQRQKSNTLTVQAKTPQKTKESQVLESAIGNCSQVKKKVIELDTTAEQTKYSQLIDLYEQDIEPIDPSQNFVSSLYHYQAIALSWMLKREGKIQSKKSTQLQNQQIHPLWTEYELPDKQSLYYNELTAQTSLLKPIMKNRCHGGVLADQMGLGKTVMMAALIASSVQKTIKRNQAQTLVIVPLTLLSQWQSQIKKHTKNLSVVCYYTSQRHRLIDQLSRFNVVVTTYGTISHEFTKLTAFNKVGLYKYKWKRIILDQAHYIKGRIIQTSKAVYNLQGDCRWCLTGTPIQNGLNDLFALIHFIKYPPWSEFECWQKYIIKPHENGDEHVYDVLRTLLKKVFLRRTKASKDHSGKSIIELPKKTSKIQILQMSPTERQFYDMVYESTKAKLDELDKLGIITARYMQVLEILIKLRQVCCHPLLFKSVTKFTTDPLKFEGQLRKFVKKRQQINQSNALENQQNYYEPMIEGDQQIRVEIAQQTKKVSENFLKQTIDNIMKDRLQNCIVCMDDVQDPVITSCLHIFCRTCMIRQIQQYGNCPSCRQILTKQDFLLLPRQNRFNFSLDSDKFQNSSKMNALMDHLKVMMETDDKAVVFSQFLGMLDLLEYDLKKNNIRYVRMQGSTPQKQRARIISDFTNNPQIKVFLVSLKTAGVGLNLVAANKVFLMDPWWNPGVEDQAIERVHRIGQKKQVQVVRFIMDKTIEMRMVQLNNEKKNLSQLVLSHKEIDSESKMDKLRYLMEKY